MRPGPAEHRRKPPPATPRPGTRWIAAARTKIEGRAKERFEREQAEHQAKLAAREAKEKATGKKPGGKLPEPPVDGPRPTDQSHG